MTTRTIDTQTFEGERISCAKFVSDEPFVWKAAQIITAETDYYFQVAIKALSDTTISIQVGDTVKHQDITTDFTRFVIPFLDITNQVNDSLYIFFPSGTYWVYNLQVERGTSPSQWRPAPEDAEEYADEAARAAVNAQTQLDIFNKLTNNGQVQGIYLLDGQLYINGEYIASKSLSGDTINGGIITGTQINIGNGVFVVDGGGNVTAANINITGGTINIDTEGALAENKIILRHLYNGVTKYISLSGDNVIVSVQNDSSQNRDAIQMSGDTISGIRQPGGSGLNQAFKLYSITGAGNLELYDVNGKKRARLNGDGLTFYASDGTTVTKNYPST